ncbi:MAG: ABC transporter permease [Acidobacteriia bacterium]|nr:ABC transporter permease [Terriglobia bacterium]
MMSGLFHDVRYAVRQLRKSPGFTAVAAITLALGIGANTAIFSVVDFILLRPLAVANPQQVSYLAFRQKGDWKQSFSYPEFSEIRSQTGSIFSDTAAAQLFQMEGLRAKGKNETIWTNYVSGNFFEVLGIRPAVGRLIQPSEGNVAGTDPVIVLSYSFWKTHFDSDPSVVGTQASVSGKPVTIIGVAPEGFRGVSSLIDSQGYLPLSMATTRRPGEQKSDLFTDRKARELTLVSRLKPEVSLPQVQSALEVIAGRLSQQHPEDSKDMLLHAFHLGPLGLVVDSSDPLPMVAALFLILAALVLALACFNVANLFLVRATARQREMALRAALGAGRWTLVRQLLTESLALTVLGCVFGIMMGIAASHTLASLPIGTKLPIAFDFAFDWRVFSYAFAAAIFCTLVVGLVPALRASGLNLNETLRESSRTTSSGRQRLRSVLVATQVAGSLTLLIITALFVRSLYNVQRSDLGFDPSHVLNITLDPHQSGLDDKQGRAFYRELLERVRSLPSVQSASLAGSVPFGYYSLTADVEIPGYKPAPGQSAGFNAVSPGYFETMRIPVVAGRSFRDSDQDGNLRVVIVNEAMVKHYWPNEEPLGKQITIQRDNRSNVVQVVGVAKNSKTGDLAGPIGDYIYAPMAQNYMSTETLQVRTTVPPENMAANVVATIHSLAPALPVFDVQSMTAALGTLNGILVFQLGAALVACLGGLGLVLAIIGVYGVLSYVSAQRTHEIGIRMALGAPRGAVLKMILRGGVVIVVPGLLLGILASVGMARLVGSLLVGVTATDASTFAGVSLLLTFVALATCYIPARRAAKIDPMVALRYE